MKGKRGIDFLVSVLAIALLASSLFPSSIPSIATNGSFKNQLLIKNYDCHSNSHNCPCEPTEQEEESGFETKPFFLDPGCSVSSFAFAPLWRASKVTVYDSNRIISPLPIYLVTRSLLI